MLLSFPQTQEAWEGPKNSKNSSNLIINELTSVSNLIHSGLAMIIKQRESAGKIAQMNLVGNVTGKDCIIVDDMIDTAVSFIFDSGNAV